MKSMLLYTSSGKVKEKKVMVVVLAILLATVLKLVEYYLTH